MGGHRPSQLAVEVPFADRLQIGPDLRREALLPECEQLPGMADDVGVGRVLHRSGITDQGRVGEVHDVAEARVDGPPQGDLRGQTPRADPAVAIRRSAVAEVDAVEHAVAVEHVVLADRFEHGIRAVAHERPA